MTAVIVSVGNELLFGETVDTNSAWLGRALTELGIAVTGRQTVGDVAADIQAGVADAVTTADVVVVTGGLGPTDDDLTREAVAAELGRGLVLDEAYLRALEERFRARGFGSLPATNRKQAEVPEGAEPLPNPHGTAPGLVMDHEDTIVVLLPGVPREMKGIFNGSLANILRGRFAGRLSGVRHRLIHTTGVPESKLAELIEAAYPDPEELLGKGVGLAYLPDLRGVDLRISVSEDDGEDTDERLGAVEARLEAIVGRWRFHARSGDIAEAVLDALRSRGWTLATAESCTAGLVASRLTDHAGSSDVFAGGVVAYANEAKRKLLGVLDETLERHGAVSEPVVREMAEGAVRNLDADIGVAITGIAGPGGGTDEKPVGTVWIAVATEEDNAAVLHRFVGDRSAVRERAAQAALDAVLRAVQEGGGP